MSVSHEGEAQPFKLTFWLPSILGFIVLSFIGATAVVHWQQRALDRNVLDIANTAAPSIAHLAVARREVRLLQVALHEELGRRTRGESSATTDAMDAEHALDRRINQYLALPLLPHERELWTTISLDKNALDEVVARFDHEATAGDLASATATLTGPVAEKINLLDEAISHTIESDANQVHELALEIGFLRTKSTYLAFSLDVLCAIIAVGAAVVLRRIVQARAELVARSRRLHEERESALDDFAGRVAHDILSPLATVGFALQIAVTAGEDQRRRVLERGVAALTRRMLGAVPAETVARS